MKILHHNDADGHCAAAIVFLMLLSPFEPFTDNDLIEYNHNGTLNLNPDDIRQGETVYIVDLALDNVILNAIITFLHHDCTIIHIDHHIGGQRFAESLNENDKKMYDRVIKLHRTDVSASMLTWVYANMTDEERKHPNEIPFDFTEEYSHIGFYPETAIMREHFIPVAIRYIDDNDVWRHQFLNSKYFALAYGMEDNQVSNTKFWDNLLFGNTKMIEMVNHGEILYRYQEKQNERICRNGFEVEIDGHKGYAVNCPSGNSRLFGELINQYDFVVKYAYDGNMKKWRYTFYSSNDSEFDCAKYCKEYFNGGGHLKAAGGWLEYNYFQKDE
jgi:oligoribonuclease NrnB/cAMP/cGMP phosphodiesterase (DHH superfamily)